MWVTRFFLKLSSDTANRTALAPISSSLIEMAVSFGVAYILGISDYGKMKSRRIFPYISEVWQRSNMGAAS